jgi:hypothetical protein
MQPSHAGAAREEGDHDVCVATAAEVASCSARRRRARSMSRRISPEPARIAVLLAAIDDDSTGIFWG